jgi:hypothetical protein
VEATGEPRGAGPRERCVCLSLVVLFSAITSLTHAHRPTPSATTTTTTTGVTQARSAVSAKLKVYNFKPTLSEATAAALLATAYEGAQRVREQMPYLLDDLVPLKDKEAKV